MNTKRASRNLFKAALGVGAALLLAGPVKAQWAQLPIKGGGWVTGMVFSNNGGLYCRTDAGGAYRRDGSVWTQLIVSSAFPNNPEIVRIGNGADGRAYSVESIAVDPNNSANLWLATGNPGYFESGFGYLLHSTNSGATFAKANLSGVPMGGNQDYRMNGERLAIDPANSAIVYFGSRTQGLYVSTNANDSSNSWSVVGAVDPGSTPGGDAAGVNIVVFDPSRGTNTSSGYTRTNVIYAASAVKGLYRSTDGGFNWSVISSQGSGPASSDFISSMKVAGGNLYVVAAGKAWRMTSDQSGGSMVWTDITPPNQTTLTHIAVAPSNPQHLVVTDAGMTANHFWRSNDGGATWDNMPRSIDGGAAGWRTSYAGNGYLSVGQIVFNPTNDSDLWFAEGAGTFETYDTTYQPAGQNVTWSNRSDGIEEVVASDVVASGGNVNVACWDLQGFHFYTNSISTPSQQLGAFPHEFALGQSLSMAGLNQNYVALVSTDQRPSSPPNNYSSFSYSGGTDNSWSLFPSITNTGTGNYGVLLYDNNPIGLRRGMIAVAASNTSSLVWIPANGRTTNDSTTPYFTSNGGASWSPCAGLPGDPQLSLYFFSDRRPLCADGALDNTFYVYTKGTTGVYISTDGGQSFHPASGAADLPADGTADAQLRSEPGIPGNLWWAGGAFAWGGQSSQGLHHSTDGGQTFPLVTNVDSCWQVGFGAAYPGNPNPTVYIYGSVGGQYGYYASTDEGGTWQFLGDYPLGIFEEPTCINGDMSLLGRVYVGFPGNGFAYRDSTLGAGYSGAVAAPTITDTGAAPAALARSLAVTGASRKVAIADTTSGAVIRYTLDGKAPTPLSPRYAGPFSALSGATVKAAAWRTSLRPSPVAAKTFAPPVPTSLTAAAPGRAIVELRWTPANGATGYRVYRSTSGGAPVLAASPTLAGFSDSGRRIGVTYTYQVSATNSGGLSALSAAASAKAK